MLHQRDFRKRRIDVPNMMFRMAQYQFLFAAVTLVGISAYVHWKPAATKPAASTIRTSST